MKKLLIIALLPLAAIAQQRKHNIVYSNDEYAYNGVKNICFFGSDYIPTMYSNLSILEIVKGSIAKPLYISANDVIVCKSSVKYFRLQIDTVNVKWYFTGRIDSIEYNGAIIIPNNKFK